MTLRSPFAAISNTTLAAVLAILVALGSTVMGVSPAGASGFFTGNVARAHDAEPEMLDTINRLRSDIYGLAPLAKKDWGDYQGYLECIASENAASARLAHYPASCNQGFVEAEILAARYSSVSGGSTNALVNQWNESDGHRQIMLAVNANQASVGVYCIGHTSWAIAWISNSDGAISQNLTPKQPQPDSFFTDNDYNCQDSTPVPQNGPIGAYTPADTIEALITRSDFTTKQADVLRLYLAFFDREAGINGANYWIGVNAHGYSIDAISGQFAVSDEFINTYGSVDNRRYLEILYQNVLGRQPDAKGFNYWLGLLDSGQLNRGSVVRWVAANDEFVNNNLYNGK
ncbi:MAG: DUF4214 domain-containing protein [Acidimicrobiales bacterium]|nr:DUF4214 domain-containing protein [Acidimicrobiales bacterium]